MSEQPQVGEVGWFDLTVEDAEGVRDFYKEVVGWAVEEHSMGDYSDFVMSSPASGNAVAGVCHARGINKDLPAQWLIYLTVSNLDESIRRCMELGGKVVAGPRDMGSYGKMCVIQDPAGAVMALMQT